MPETRKIHWNADIHGGHGEEVHRQSIQRREEKGKEMEEKFCKDQHLLSQKFLFMAMKPEIII